MAAAKPMRRGSVVPGLRRTLVAHLPETDVLYVVKSSLGRGATAFVYECLETTHPCGMVPDDDAEALEQFIAKAGEGEGRRVALKELTAEHCAACQRADPSAVDPALDEARILASVDHPNIVTHYRHFAQGAEAFIVTEPLKGGSLLSLMRKESATRNGFEDTTAAMFVAQMLAGLVCLHSKNIVHRDIKAANVLLTADCRIAKLADFGIARRITEPVDLARWTRPDGALNTSPLEGSAFWLAPECTACPMLHPCVDIWALGCTAIELLSGEPPFFDRKSIPSVLWQLHQLTSDPTAEIKRVRNLTPEAEDFITHCLRLKPSDRPSAAQLLQHPWVAAAAAALQKAVPGSILPNVSSTDTPSQTPPLAPVGSFAQSEAAGNGTPLPPSGDVGSNYMRSDSQPDLGATSRSHAQSHADLIGATRTTHRREVLNSLERGCDASRPAALAHWLIGTHRLEDVYELQADALLVGGPGVTAGPTGVMPPPAAVSSHSVEAKRRSARESVALVWNEVAQGVTLWRTFQRQGPSHGSDEEREAARASSVAILKYFGSVAAAWRAHAQQVFDCRFRNELQRARGIAPEEVRDASASTRTSAADAAGSPVVPENSTAGFERELLASHMADGATHSLTLTWLLLEALTYTGFWSASGDIRPLFHGVGGEATGFEPAGRDRSSGKGSTASTSPASGPRDTDSGVFDHSTSSQTSLNTTDGFHSPLQQLVGVERQQEECVTAVANIFALSVLALGVPSAAPYAQRVLSSALQSSWAVQLLLARGRTRSAALKLIADAMDLDRLLHDRGSLLDGVASVALARLGAAFAPALRPPPKTGGASSSSGPLGGTLNSVTLDATLTSGALSRTLGSVPTPAQGGASLSDVRGAVASMLHRDVHPVIVDLCTHAQANDPLEDGLRCLAGVLCGVTQPGSMISSGFESTKLQNHAAAHANVNGRVLARLVLLELGIIDAEWAQRTFPMDSFLTPALDDATPEILRHAFVSLLPALTQRLPSNAFTPDAPGRASRRKDFVSPPKQIALLLQVRPSQPDAPDVPLAALLQVVNQHSDFARDFADDATFFRSLVRRIKEARGQHARALGLDLVRTLFVNTTDPGRFVENEDLCKALVGIAQEEHTPRDTTLAACELLNAFAYVAVF